MSDMSDEETRATQKLYNPANIDKMIDRCKNNEFAGLVFYEKAEKELVLKALEKYRDCNHKKDEIK